jgi:hypothetical protein
MKVELDHFLTELTAKGVNVSVHDGKLRIKAPAGVVDPLMLAKIGDRKQNLLIYLTQLSAPKGISGESAAVPAFNPYRIYKNNSGDNALVFETKAEFDALVDYFHQLFLWKQRNIRDQRIKTEGAMLNK